MAFVWCFILYVILHGFCIVFYMAFYMISYTIALLLILANQEFQLQNLSSSELQEKSCTVKIGRRMVDEFFILTHFRSMLKTTFKIRVLRQSHSKTLKMCRNHKMNVLCPRMSLCRHVVRLQITSQKLHPAW